jgi:hypothetical protein
MKKFRNRRGLIKGDRKGLISIYYAEENKENVVFQKLRVESEL